MPKQTFPRSTARPATITHDAVQLNRRLLLGGALLGAPVLAGLAACASRKKETVPASMVDAAPKRPELAVSEADLGAFAQTMPLAGSYAQRPEVMEQVKGIAQRVRLPETYVRNAIGNANFLPSVPRLILPAGRGVRRNWAAYRSRFIEPIRIRAGVQFWRENAPALQRAEREYGVPAHSIVGIIGVETIYGRHMGNMRVIDALSTLSFDFPQEHPRAQARNRFFREELEAYLLLCARNRDNPLDLRGSYAGAMGLPQFMPSSWLKYAVDYDGDKHIDLFSSPTDAIGSVANYFRAFGWEPGLPPLYNVAFDQERLQLATLLEPDIRPSFTLQEFAAHGAQLPDGVPQLGQSGKLALIELENGQTAAPSYYAGTQNFYVITRYNNSSYYAKAVIDLGEAVRRAV